jgi:hypothetical protein
VTLTRDPIETGKERFVQLFPPSVDLPIPKPERLANTVEESAAMELDAAPSNPVDEVLQDCPPSCEIITP